MIYVLLADGFEEVEAMAPVDILRRGGVEAALVGVGSQWIIGAHGIRVQADVTLDAVDADGCDMLVLPGGAGYQVLRDTPAVGALIDNVAARGRVVAAICAAPTVLAGRGLLDGRRAVCYPGMEDEMGGAVLCSGEQVVRDGSFVTAEGPGSAYVFGYELLELARGRAVMEEVRRGMYWRA